MRPAKSGRAPAVPEVPRPDRISGQSAWGGGGGKIPQEWRGETVGLWVTEHTTVPVAQRRPQPREVAPR